MVRYISAKGKSLDQFMKEIAPDFNSKLSAILKAASRPTWDLQEIRSKEPEETNTVYFYTEKDNKDHPVMTTIKMYYKGKTDSGKTFYIDITKRMCVQCKDETLIDKKFITDAVANDKIKLVTHDKTGDYYEFMYVNGEVDGEGETWEETIVDDIGDWDVWTDCPDIQVGLNLSYPTDKVEEHYDVDVDKIDETVQSFVDTYIDK